jgi:hypothetical protein
MIMTNKFLKIQDKHGVDIFINLEQITFFCEREKLVMFTTGYPESLAINEKSAEKLADILSKFSF